MITVTLNPGETVKVELADTDGEFVIAYGNDAVTVTADLEDDTGRGGVIYAENFSAGYDKVKVRIVEDERPCCGVIGQLLGD